MCLEYFHTIASATLPCRGRLGKAGRGLSLLSVLAFCHMAVAAPPVPARPAVEPIDVPLPFFDGRNLVRPLPGERDFPPLQLRLSRARYWAKDGHLDVLVQLAGDEQSIAGTRITGRIINAAGAESARFELDAPGPRFMLYPVIPDDLLAGGEAALTLEWTRADGGQFTQTCSFRVELAAPPAPRAGRVPLRLDNPDGVTLAGLPVTVGVPFPRGLLTDTAHLRLVDEQGVEWPLQIMETARWSKFGTLKWVLCDFTVDLDGQPRTLYLEYGQDRRPAAKTGNTPWTRPADAGAHAAFPSIDAGRMQCGADGLWFDAAGNGDHQPVLPAAAFSGAFVEHENGKIFRPDPDTPFVIEENGPVKTVILRQGWYVAEADKADADDQRARFCRYVTRYIIHRDSALVRFFHTWIFTGDGNRDRIRNMGWHFPTAADVAPGGFLSGFDAADAWLTGDALVQYDYDQADLLANGGVRPRAGLRAPGVARLDAPGARLYFGVKDFWQNFPSELEFADGALWFHNWPRHNRAALERFNDVELTPEMQLAFLQARFAHEGPVLDFRLPEIAGAEIIWGPATGNGRAWQEHHWELGQPESVNAQGIARTEEFWIYLTPASTPDAQTRAVLAGLDAERLRAAVDPAWMAASGAFYEVHPRDPERFPEIEQTYETVALAPGRWAERLGIYGMWIYGDLPAWQLGLERRVPDIYRAYRKHHHAWPYSWLPYARSGDSRMLKWAAAAMRHLTDTAFNHYADNTVELLVGPGRHRKPGIWTRSALPWVGATGSSAHSYEAKVDHLYAAWHLTGDIRARDQARAWSREAVRRAVEGEMESLGGGLPFRTPASLLKTYIDQYEAEFDPWFLAAAHAIAEGHLHLYRASNWTGVGVYEGHEAFLRFSGCSDYREFFLHMTDHWGAARPRDYEGYSGLGWFSLGVPFIDCNAFAWWESGHDTYRRRAAAWVDPAFTAVFEGETPNYLQGYFLRGGTSTAAFTGYYLRHFPLALAVMAIDDGWTQPLHHDFTQQLPVEIAFHKLPGQPLLIQPGSIPAGRGRHWERWGSGRAYYRFYGPGDQCLQKGEWGISDSMEQGVPETQPLAVPADAPAGVYRMLIEARDNQPHWTHTVRLPFSGDGIPEVMMFKPGQSIQVGRQGHYWFHVPAGLASFQVELEIPQQGVLLASIWRPDHRRAWRLDHHAATAGQPDRTLCVEIDVAPELSGRLWRIVLPEGGIFRLDERIPPYMAPAFDKWFDPTPKFTPRRDDRHSENPAHQDGKDKIS